MALPAALLVPTFPPAAACTWQQALSHTPPPLLPPPQLERSAQRAALQGVSLSCDYLLMLVAMTFNIGLLVSAVLGACLGTLAFSHLPDRAAAAAAAGRRGAAHSAPEEQLIVGSLRPAAADAADLERFAHAPLPVIS